MQLAHAVIETKTKVSGTRLKTTFMFYNTFLYYSATHEYLTTSPRDIIVLVREMTKRKAKRGTILALTIPLLSVVKFDFMRETFILYFCSPHLAFYICFIELRL